jgi:hypothetical protein
LLLPVFYFIIFNNFPLIIKTSKKIPKPKNDEEDINLAKNNKDCYELPETLLGRNLVRKVS